MILEKKIKKRGIERWLQNNQRLLISSLWFQNRLKSITPYGVTKPSYDLKVVPPQADRIPPSPQIKWRNPYPVRVSFFYR
jgi:hypothetical protein